MVMSQRVTSIAFALHAASIAALFIIGIPESLKDPADMQFSAFLTLMVWAGLPTWAAMRLPQRAARVAAICSLSIPGLMGLILAIRLGLGLPLLRPRGAVFVADIAIVTSYVFALTSYVMDARRARRAATAT